MRPLLVTITKKRTIPGFTRRVSIGCTVLFARHDPTKSSRRQETEDCARLRLLQAQETESKSTNYQSLFILLASDISTLEFCHFSFVRSERHITHTYVHIHIHITHKHSQEERKTITRLHSRYYTLPHISFRLLNVAICMPPPTCVQIPKCGQFMREICDNTLFWLQQTPPSEVKLMRVSCLLCCCLAGTAYVQPVYACVM